MLSASSPPPMGDNVAESINSPTRRILIADADLPALNFLAAKMLGYKVGVLTAEDVIADQLDGEPESKHATIRALFADYKTQPCFVREDDGWKHEVSTKLLSETGHSKMEFCTNWGQSGALLVRRKISWREASPGVFHGFKMTPGGEDLPLQAASDPLVASIRALLADEYGDSADVPVELSAPPAQPEPRLNAKVTRPVLAKPAGFALYRARLKSRKEMDRDIPRDQLGWWHDVCPGDELLLRTATAEDLARCHLRPGSSRDPGDYLCENFDTGSLVLKAAIAHIKEEPLPPAPCIYVDTRGQLVATVSAEQVECVLGPHVDRIRASLGISRSPVDDDTVERLVALLDEVRQQFSRDDDLPDGLLPRIDEALAQIGVDEASPANAPARPARG